MVESPTRGLLKIVILHELKDKQLSVYDLLKILKDRLPREPSPGSIYPIIKELSEKGYVIEIPGEKKTIKITEKGKMFLEEMFNRSREMVYEKLAILKTYDIINDSEYNQIKDFMETRRASMIKLMKTPGALKLLHTLINLVEKDPKVAEAKIRKLLEILEDE